VVFVTVHAALRVLERIGAGDAEAQRLANEAYHSGLELHEITGPLRKYLSKLKGRRSGARVRVYEGFIFIFDRDRLVTVYPVPENEAHEIPGKRRKQRAPKEKKRLRHFSLCSEDED
jgi:hypothetical protein